MSGLYGFDGSGQANPENPFVLLPLRLVFDLICLLQIQGYLLNIFKLILVPQKLSSLTLKLSWC